jgi:hypothetical protein
MKKKLLDGRATTFVWWSTVGAAKGRPWMVQRGGDKHAMQAKHVVMHGVARTLNSDEGFADLECGPRGVIEVEGSVTVE